MAYLGEIWQFSEGSVRSRNQSCFHLFYANNKDTTCFSQQNDIKSPFVCAESRILIVANEKKILIIRYEEQDRFIMNFFLLLLGRHKKQSAVNNVVTVIRCLCGSQMTQVIC